jgi:hypothetical protein
MREAKARLRSEKEAAEAICLEQRIVDGIAAPSPMVAAKSSRMTATREIRRSDRN